MKEIEIKILEIDVDKLIVQLKELGARRVFNGKMDVNFFDFDDRRLKKSKKCLRLRQVGDKVEFTLKQKLEKKQAKIVDEYEVCVSDFHEMKTILYELGLHTYRHYNKQRTSYVIGSTRFEIDIIEDLPAFLEIEAASVSELFEWVEKLGYKKEQALPWSGSDVLKHYGKL
ncbi:MAG: class IV adenylate cyclase [Patescibacteria group bacterium]